MDKRVIFAVAGSGKTSYIIDELNVDSRVLIITYTINNQKNIINKIILKFGFVPNGIKIFTYFTFMYNFCFKPISGKANDIKGLNWNPPPAFTLRMKRTDIRFYIDDRKRLYHNRIAKLFDVHDVMSDISERIEKYFDFICVDEVQDFAGHDFNFLMRLSEVNVKQLFVGDFYQHTFDTSRDGNVNSSLHNNYDDYKKKFLGSGYILDIKTLSASYRCSLSVCNFVSENLGIMIDSHRTDKTLIKFVQCENEAKELFYRNDIVKLFYDSSKKYDGYTENWGATKGEDKYNDVCIVLNKNTLVHYSENALMDLPAKTKNKLYVAFTRAKGNVYLIPESTFSKYKK